MWGHLRPFFPWTEKQTKTYKKTNYFPWWANGPYSPGLVKVLAALLLLPSLPIHQKDYVYLSASLMPSLLAPNSAPSQMLDGIH